ncbi:hypothetical protein [Helicobacter trogontum]|uniref:Uncharacterized protein n=1 Tax=Helicobacter trogontum TaxID=50960 RepID=A0A4U8S4B7_9HELI|nr:hypothetical protein [Helicobacter trogontum]TLD80648.1 hypothetical protein LS81_009380 [Helicobacter trogontum]
MNKMYKYIQLVKYAELCWASYSEGLNSGMYGNKEKKWGFNERGEYYTDDEIKRLKKIKILTSPPTTKPLVNLNILSLKNTMSVLVILKPITSLHDLKS